MAVQEIALMQAEEGSELELPSLPKQGASSRCSLCIAPLARLLVAVLAFICAGSSVGSLVPTTIQELPLQVVAGYTLLGTEYTRPFIPDAQASCPISALLELLIFGLACNVGLEMRSAPRAIDAAATYLGAQALTVGLTDWMKNWCGVPRPNYFSACGWDAASKRCARFAVPDAELRRSFPSGHSSTSAAAATVLTLYLVRRLRAHRDPHRRKAAVRHHAAREVAMRALLSLALPAPGVVAAWVAASRVHDHWHHPSDVVAGSGVGIACALIIFELNGPSPDQMRSNVAHGG